MRILIATVALAAATACSEKNAIAEKVEERADNRAEAMEEAAESMTNALQQNIAEQQANMVRRAGEERAEAIRAADLNPDALTDEQKRALIKGDQGTPAPARR